MKANRSIKFQIMKLLFFVFNRVSVVIGGRLLHSMLSTTRCGFVGLVASCFMQCCRYSAGRVAGLGCDDVVGGVDTEWWYSRSMRTLSADPCHSYPDCVHTQTSSLSAWTTLPSAPDLLFISVFYTESYFGTAKSWILSARPNLNRKKDHLNPR